MKRQVRVIYIPTRFDDASNLPNIRFAGHCGPPCPPFIFNLQRNQLTATALSQACERVLFDDARLCLHNHLLNPTHLLKKTQVGRKPWSWDWGVEVAKVEVMAMVPIMRLRKTNRTVGVNQLFMDAQIDGRDVSDSSSIASGSG